MTVVVIIAAMFGMDNDGRITIVDLPATHRKTIQTYVIQHMDSCGLTVVDGEQNCDICVGTTKCGYVTMEGFVICSTCRWICHSSQPYANIANFSARPQKYSQLQLIGLADNARYAFGILLSMCGHHFATIRQYGRCNICANGIVDTLTIMHNNETLINARICDDCYNIAHGHMIFITSKLALISYVTNRCTIPDIANVIRIHAYDI